MCNIMIQMVLWLPVPFALLILHMSNTFYRVMIHLYSLGCYQHLIKFYVKFSCFFVLKRRICVEKTSCEPHQTYE